MSRTFTIANSCVDSSGGRYKSATPASAAKKAASKLFKKAKAIAKYKNIRRITFSIRETTVGSDKNVYDYKANRVKLDKPVVRVIAGKEIVNHFKIEIVADVKKKQPIKCKKIQKQESMAASSTSSSWLSMGGNHNASHKSSKKPAKKPAQKSGRKRRGGAPGDGTDGVDNGINIDTVGVGAETETETETETGPETGSGAES
jgi:hypothetical protein